MQAEEQAYGGPVVALGVDAAAHDEGNQQADQLAADEDEQHPFGDAQVPQDLVPAPDARRSAQDAGRRWAGPLGLLRCAAARQWAQGRTSNTCF